jgi:hypothetical protein
MRRGWHNKQAAAASGSWRLSAERKERLQQWPREAVTVWTQEQVLVFVQAAAGTKIRP